MKSPANKTGILLAGILLLASSHARVRGQSRCNCPEPPGGVVTCEKDQVPICRVQDGKVISECASMPPDKKTTTQQSAWLLSIIIGKEVSEKEVMTDPQYQRILLDAQYKSARLMISFVSLVPSMKDVAMSPFFNLGHASQPDSVTTGPPFALMPIRPTSRPAKYVGPSQSFETYNEAVELFHKEDYDGALAKFRLALQVANEQHSTPNAVLSLRGIADALARKGQTEEAVATLRQAMQLAPGNADLIANAGLLLFNQEKYSEAADAFRKAIMLNSNQAELYSSFGSVLFLQKNYAEAETSFVKAIELNPTRENVYCLLGITLSLEQKYVQAIEAFTRAAELNPTNTVNYSNIGLIQYRMGNYREAEKTFKKAIELEGRGEHSHHLFGELGRVLYTELRYAEAEAAFQEALSNFPITLEDKTPYRIGLADSLYAQHKLKEAKIEYRKALQLDPQNQNLLDRLRALSKQK